MSRIMTMRGDTARLARVFGVTEQTVRAALRGATGSERAERIRTAAIRMGCRERAEVNNDLND